MSLPIKRPAPDADKAAWRIWAKGVRSSLDTPRISEKVCRAIANWPLYQTSQHILTYMAFGSEVDVAALQQGSDKTFYVTRTWDNSLELSVHKLDGVRLEPHLHGYLQPLANSPKVPPELIDLVLVPGLAFSQSGQRLGYGKGYYDRLLPKTHNATWLGVTADALVVPKLPHENHDVTLDYLATESGIINCQG